MDFLHDLNPQQRQAVQASDGPVLVLAGPGSGKTRVLTHRIAYLIGEIGISPYHILAVTFTNKAAQEMKTRVLSLVGEQVNGLTLGTFHAISASILRREAQHLPFKSNFSIFDSDDQLALVKTALKDVNLDPKQYKAASLQDTISRAKNELIMPKDYPEYTYHHQVVKKVFNRYQDLLLANNALDFDDLLYWMVNLLQNNSSVREKYARRFKQILVDEFQDTNMAQYELLKHLASVHHSIFVVGDIDQSIYAWRGADYRNLRRFEDEYPTAQVIFLDQTYRSTQAVLNVAMKVIEQNIDRKPHQLLTNRGEGEKVVLQETYDDRSEAAFVVETITNLVLRKKAQLGDFAIMYRTNAQSRLLEEAFLHAKIPYKLVGAQRFYGRREVKDILAYMRIIQNPADEVSLYRIINVPGRGIGEKTVNTLHMLASKRQLASGELLIGWNFDANHLLEGGFSGRISSNLMSFSNLLAKWRAEKEHLTPLSLMDLVLKDTDYRAYLDDGTEVAEERWENILELRRLAAEYQESGLAKFLEDVSLVSDQDTYDAISRVVTLLTLHAAKGLEFPIVFIVGLNDGILPHARSKNNPDAVQEERRLFYVGLTRAKDHLYLIQPLNRNSFGFSEPTLPSGFLEDIPSELLRYEPLPGRVNMPISRKMERWEVDKSAPRRAIQARYYAGAKVSHPVFGEGMVLNSHIQDDDEIVDIFFENIGLKRLAASLARLELKQ